MILLAFIAGTMTGSLITTAILALMSAAKRADAEEYTSEHLEGYLP